jgi:hypothetical protein
MKYLTVICVSRSDTGREKFTGTLKQCPEYIFEGLLNGDNDEQEHPDYTASVYLISLSKWRKRHIDSSPGHHLSHYLSKHGEELCLGDYL